MVLLLAEGIDFARLAESAGPVGVAIALITMMVVVIHKYVAKPAIDSFLEISKNSMVGTENCKEAAANNRMSAEMNLRAAEANVTVAKVLDRMITVELEERSKREGEEENGPHPHPAIGGRRERGPSR